jgi:malate dehydrogenase (oxaloacetate-decarboxylating)(NADP+)
LSSGGRIPSELLSTMAKDPIIFVLANPDPEIPYDECVSVRPDAIVATGRSDYPNQVNNVLGFPFIFRGALDVAATSINEEMKLAAAHALATLAREPVPSYVSAAYGGEEFAFGPRYIIPKPVDPRVLPWVSSAVAQAAIDTGVAQEKLDMVAYRARLTRLASKLHQQD